MGPYHSIFKVARRPSPIPLLGGLLVLLVIPSLALAQTIPPAGQPGIVEKSLEESRPELPLPDITPPSITIEDSRKLKDAGAGPSFIIQGVKIEGNTLFEEDELKALINIEQGMSVTLGILNLMAQEITSFYGKAGYILTQAYIPEQEVVDGIVLIRILEGKVGDIEVSGNQDFDSQDIIDRMKPVQKEPVFKESTLEKSLLELNAALGLQVKAVLKPGTMTGTADLDIQVTETRSYNLSFDGDNYGSRFTGTQRFGLTGTAGNLLTLGDRFSVRAVKSNEDQFFINPSYSIPLNTLGTTFGISYVFSEFNLGENLAVLNVGGNAQILSFYINHSLHRSRDSEFHINVGGDYRKFENSILFVLQSDDELVDGYIGMGGQWTDFLKGSTSFNVKVQKGFTEKDVTDPLNSRNNGKGDVLLLKTDFQRTQYAFIDRTYFIFKGRGQFAFDRVLSPDLIAIGGYGSVRGYPLAEAAGDNGYLLTAEYVVPFPFKVELTDKKGWQTLDQILSLYGFIDHGHVFVRNKQVGESDRELTGVGAGLRVNIRRWSPNYPLVSFNLTVGFPVFEEAEPSDGSSHTLYLGGVIAY